MPTYPDLTKKLQRLTMTRDDWTALSKLIDPRSYATFYTVYKTRERGEKPYCGANHNACNRCQGGRCTFNGFCSNQE